MRNESEIKKELERMTSSIKQYRDQLNNRPKLETDPIGSGSEFLNSARRLHDEQGYLLYDSMRVMGERMALAWVLGADIKLY